MTSFPSRPDSFIELSSKSDFREQRDRKTEDEHALITIIDAAYQRTDPLRGAANFIGRQFESYEPDPEYSVFRNRQYFDNLTRDIQPENLDRFNHVVSDEQAWAVRNRVLEEQAMQEIVASSGAATGITAEIATAVLNPSSLLIGAGVGGIASAAARGGLRAAKAANAATRIGRLRTMQKRGLIAGAVAGGASEGVIEGSIALGDDSNDAGDVVMQTLLATVFGSVLGGAGGLVESSFARRALGQAEAKQQWAEFVKLRQTNPSVKLTDKGAEFFDEFASQAQRAKFVEDLGEALDMPEDIIEGFKIIHEDETFAEVARRMQGGGSGDPKASIDYAMGAAAANEFGFSWKDLPAAVKSNRVWMRQLATGQATPEEVAQRAAAQAGKDVDEDFVKALKKAVKKRDKGKQPGDLFLMGRLNGSGSKWNPVRFDGASEFGSSPSELSRMFGSGLVEDALGPKKGVQVAPASRWQQATENRYAQQVFEPYNKLYRDFTREKGMVAGSHLTRRGKEYFNELVGRGIRRGPDELTGEFASKPVRDAIEVHRQAYSDMLGMLQRHGTLEDVPDNPNYLARRYDHEKIYAYDEILQEGELPRLFSQAIIDERGLDQEKADMIGKAMYHIVRNSRISSLEKANIIRGSNRAKMFGTLEELQANGHLGDISKDDVKTIVNALSPDPEQTAGEAATLTNRQKRRTSLNELTRMTLKKRDGTEIDVGFEDLLDNDAERNMRIYIQEATGAAAMNELMSAISLEAGEEIANLTDLRRVLRNADIEASGGVETEQIKKLYGSAKSTRDSAFDVLTSAVMGRNRYDNTKWREAMSIFRGINLLARGGQFAIAAAPEAGRVAANGGIVAMTSRMPGFKSILGTAKDGTAKFDEIDEILYAAGVKGEFQSFGYTARNDVFQDSVADNALSGRLGEVARMTREKTRLATRGFTIINGQAPFQQFLRNSAGSAFVRRFERLAERGRGFGDKRLAAVGLTKQQADEIAKLYKKHGNRWDFDAWNKPQLASDFLSAVNRYSSSIVQTNDPGFLPLWMNRPLVNTLLQFRSFTFGAYHNMLLRGASIRDADEASMFLASAFAAALGYSGQVYMRSLSKDDPQAYRDERFDPMRFSMAVFQRMGVSSILPDATNTVVGMLGLGRPFQYRNSGLPTGILSNPTTDMAGELLGVSLFGEPAPSLLGSLSDGVDTRDFGRIQRILPFGNFPVVEQLMEYAGRSMLDDPDY